MRLFLSSLFDITGPIALSAQDVWSEMEASLNAYEVPWWSTIAMLVIRFGIVLSTRGVPAASVRPVGDIGWGLLIDMHLKRYMFLGW